MMERLIFVRNSLVALLFAIPAVVMLPTLHRRREGGHPEAALVG